MAADYPRVRVVVVDATTTSLLPQLHSGQLDLAVLALPIRDPDVDAELLFEEELIVIAPNDHPLAAHDRITVEQLAEHDLLLEPPGTAFRDDLDAQAKEAGVVLSTKAEVDGMRLVASLAFEGFGAARSHRPTATRWPTRRATRPPRAFRWCSRLRRAVPTSPKVWRPASVGAARRVPSPHAPALCRC